MIVISRIVRGWFSKDPSSLTRNTAFNIISSIINLTIGLVLSPILFWKLGAETYGLWSVIWAFSGTMSLVDLRLGAAAVPLVATAKQTKNNQLVIKLVSTGYFFYGFLGLLTLVTVIGLSRVPAFISWLPDIIQQDITILLPMSVLVFVLTTLISLSQGFLQGSQRYDLTASITVFVNAIRAITLIAIAITGGGLKELVLAEAGFVALRCLLFMYAVNCLIPGISFLPKPDREAFRSLFAFGAKLEIAHAAHLLSIHLDKLLLSAFMGLKVVAFYDLGAKLVNVARALSLIIISATMPVASALEASDKREHLWDFYQKGTSAVAWTGLPILLWLFISAGPLLFAWAGVTAIEAKITIWILSIGIFFNVYSGMASNIALGIGKPEIEMKRSILSALLNIVLSTGFIMAFGFPGGPIGTALALIVGSIYLFASIHSNFNRPLRHFIKPLLPALIPAIPAATGAYLILHLAGENRLEIIISVVGASVFIGLVYLLAGIRVGIFSKEFIQSIDLTS